MKIRLIDKPNKDISPKVQVMLNRGVKVSDIQNYLKNTTEHINKPEVFGENLLNSGVSMLIKHINNNDKVKLIVDSDCDGMTSAAHLINYLYEIFPDWTKNYLSWSMHEGKQHGLNDFIDRLEDSDYKLVICPDSATNDIEAIERLHNKEIDVLILDHHISDVPMSPYAVTINSQYNYPNPQLSGVGVVHKFCQYIDKLLGKNYAEKFKDLTSIGMMGDMMSMISLETKEMIFEGLKDEALVNPLIAGLAKKNEFALSKSDYLPSDKNGLKITPMGAAFFIIPMLNAMCRSGSADEKKLVFKSMLTTDAFEIVPSTKRGHKAGETERIVDQALRCCTNVKKHQDDAVKDSMQFLESKADKQLENKVLLFCLEPGDVNPNIAGLVANKLMAKYQRPVCVTTKVNNEYAGSMRGYTATGIDNFKAVAEQSSSCNWVRGHENAAGISIASPTQFIIDMNEKLEDISTEIMFYVDYMWDESSIDGNVILQLAELNDYLGTDFARPQVYVSGIHASTLQVMKSNTLKFNTSSGVSLIGFDGSEEDIEKLSKPNITINAVCKCSKNEWLGNVSPQLQIIEYEIVEPSGIEVWGF